MGVLLRTLSFSSSWVLGRGGGRPIVFIILVVCNISTIWSSVPDSLRGLDWRGIWFSEGETTSRKGLQSRFRYIDMVSVPEESNLVG